MEINCGASWVGAWRNSLVLKHQGNMVFNVTVYASHGCEKEFPPTTNVANSRMTPLTSRNLPSFRVMLTKTHPMHAKAYVTIPVNFVNSNGLDEKSAMALRTTSGNSWPVELGTWNGARKDKPFVKTKGWSKFYKDNKLKVGDICIFKLHQKAKSRSEPVILEVKIIHSL